MPMKKFIPLVIVLAVIAVIGLVRLDKRVVNSFKDATYVIAGTPVTLKNGASEIESAPDSATKITTRYFGNEVTHDFDGDGREDVAFLLRQEAGGTGVFYYVVAALNKEQGYVGSHGLLLGDRVAPQTTEMGKGNIIIVNYADRKAGESFATSPSVGKSIWLLLDPKTMQFGEVEQNFEGEADPSRMTLDMKKWVWVSAQYSDGREVLPKRAEAFTLTLGTDGRFSATTDCNRMTGTYTAVDSAISFGAIASTKMYCEGSQESEFASVLEKAQIYHFTSKGELVIDLKFDSGSAVFR